MKTLLVGCPIRKRDWILPTWKEHVRTAAKEAGLKPEFIFVAGTDEDSVVANWPDARVLYMDEPEREDVRDWDSDRFKHMVLLRNALLAEVRALKPDLFLSLDSDMLLHQDAIAGMVQVLEDDPELWAVGGKTYMAPDRWCPSYGLWESRSNHRLGMTRQDYDAVRVVDIIMGIKMMTPKAYNVDYSFHHWGEDLGWCSNLANRGGKLAWDGRITNKHVMSPDKLELLDVRCGY